MHITGLDVRPLDCCWKRGTICTSSRMNRLFMFQVSLIIAGALVSNTVLQISQNVHLS